MHLKLYVDRVLVEATIAANGRAAVVRVGGAATANVVPGLGIVPIPWRGRTVELRLSSVGHPAIGVDAELRCDDAFLPPLLGRLPVGPFAGPDCPGCGNRPRPRAADGTRCQTCFEADIERHARAVRRLWGGLGVMVTLVAAALASGAWAFSRSPNLGVLWVVLASALALMALAVGGALLLRALRGAPWHPPVATPVIHWNLDPQRMLEQLGETAPPRLKRGPSWEAMAKTLIARAL